MKIEKVAARFAGAPLICPVCREKMYVKGGGMMCKRGHSYDFSAKGYINLSRKKGDQKYGKELFSARGQILKSGYYDEIIGRLDRLIPVKSRVLDAGCGEGFFASSLSGGRKMYAIDISKAGIELNDKTRDVCWVVGDLADMPFMDGSMDVVMNFLSPANYKEFKRVLKNGGMLIKAVPGEGYLQELRHAIGKEIHSAKDAADGFEEQLKEVIEKRITYTLPVKEEDREALFKMTPLTFHESKVKKVDRITIDIILLYGRI